ncbi:ATP-dependent helicase/nuclease subunit A [Planctomycetes bacterium MalM25]|nr:ATP-dependent helicase/nuclease subunit A [Planctomycetes bacterium MalM25]
MSQSTKRVEYTEEQRAALTTRDAPVTVDAGAGCGKTFVLTERFLSHLDPAWGEPAGLDELVAITFTDAAAREMRGRIRAKCRERLQATAGDEAARWRSLLRGLEGARVSTIHAFASRLIRDHAIELGIDPAYTVLDPAEAEVLKSACVDDAIRARLAPREGQLDDDLIDAAAEFDVAGLRSRVRAMIDSADHADFGRWKRATPERLVEAWRAFYREQIAPRYAADLLADPLMRELNELIEAATPTKPEFIERLRDLGETLDTLADEASDADDALKRLQPLLGYYIPGTKKPISTAKDWPNKEAFDRYKGVRKELEAKLKKQRRAGDPESMHRTAELGLRLHRLTADAARRYRGAKRERGVLDNDDLLVEAHRLLTAPDLADARSRVAGKVRVLLVDEFQDTDPLQAELVEAIAAEGGGRVFFVGDFKQSIYRFRGAAPDVFRRRREATPPEGRLTLSRNFRSTPAVLAFVNRLFGPVFGDDYAPLRAHREQPTEGPAAEFLWTPPPEDDANADAQRHAEARVIAGRIRELCDAGAQPGDFALLFRALSNVAVYEEALREAGLDYYLVGGHAFYAQQEVYDVLNLLRAILSECDEIALAGALRSPLFGLQDETLYLLTRRGGLNVGLMRRSPLEEIDATQQAAVAHAAQTLRMLRREKDRVGAAELLRLAWEATGYDAALLAEFLGPRKQANLEKLHEQARRADASGSGLRGLVARLTEFINQPPKEALAATTAGDASVVRLMTVHASKGLEFPIVVLPDLNRKKQHDRTQATFDPRLGPLVKLPKDSTRRDDESPVGLDFWRAAELPEEEAETDRLFYVACTRAADRLILSSCWDADAPIQNRWMKRLTERFDLATGELLEPPEINELPLVAVPTPTTAAPAKQERRSGPTFAESLEAAASSSASVASPLAEQVRIDPNELVTFSVSRLSGRLRTYTAPAEADDSSDRNTAIDPAGLGTLVHAILERLEPTDGAIDRKIGQLARSLAPQHLRRHADEAGDRAIELVRGFVASETWSAMRDAERLDREVEFTLRWPHTETPALLRGYLDCLTRDAGGWRIVDYKTNGIAAAAVPAEAERYALQMAVYAHAVEAATGERPASITLAFLSPGVAHEMAWDDAAHAASISQITQAITDARLAAAQADTP